MSEVNLSTDETRVSYGIGRQLGDQLRDNPPPGVSLDAILAGLTDAFAGKPSRVDQEQMAASFKVIREIMQAEAAAKAEAAAGEGLAFLAENAKRDGITTLASGLQFEVLTAGDGAKPTREDQVRTHYHGTLIDGTVFDSSYERGQPAEFPVGGVIANAISNPPGSRPCEEGGSCGVPGLIASAVSSRGSVDNLNAITSGLRNSGFAQSDVAYWAYTGTGTVKAEYARAGQWKAQPGAAPSAAPAPAAKD